MGSLRGVVGVTVSAVSAAVLSAGCSTTTGTPVAQTTSATASSWETTEPTHATTESPKAAEPTGAPVGTAVMKVTGGTAAVTIRYRINGGAEQTETNVMLPWEKQYSVYDKLESEVAADAGSTSLTCTITMDGDKLVSFKTEVKPVCSFSYWG